MQQQQQEVDMDMHSQDNCNKRDVDKQGFVVDRPLAEVGLCLVVVARVAVRWKGC